MTPHPTPSDRDEAVRLLKALANEHRLTILCNLRHGEQSVSSLGEAIPLSQSALSQHLAWLRTEKLISARRDAQCIHYQLVDKRALAIVNLLDEVCGNLTDG